MSTENSAVHCWATLSTASLISCLLHGSEAVEPKPVMQATLLKVSLENAVAATRSGENPS